MIDRYTSEEMKNVFSEQKNFQKYLDVELSLIKYLYSINKISKEECETILKKATFDVNGIKEIEKETKHDVIAFTRNVSQSLNEERKWIHYGLTSNDVVDTAHSLLYKQANEIILKDLENLKETLKNLAIKYKYTPCIGRTHGIHADITSFGLKWALYYEELNRDLLRFNEAIKDIEVAKISGAVGTFSLLPPECQDFIAKDLSLESSKISTQVLQRDRHAFYSSVITIIGTLVEKIALEIRNLQRTEVHEVEEYFSQNQKGSSAMPHKHNPIGSENLYGWARILRGYNVSILEDNALFHERDISHSCVERVSLTDSIILIDYMLKRLNKILSTLNIYPKRMLANIKCTHNVIYSQYILTSLINKGMSREKAYDLIQPLANEAYQNEIDFFEILSKNTAILKYFTKNELDGFKDTIFKNLKIDQIYLRVGI